ncbi:nucleoside recognition domain-containing protein [Gemmatimonadota bacterium]
MSFGVKGSETALDSKPERDIVKAVTTETIVALVIVIGIFAVFTWKMGVAFTFKTAMGTAHDLILNTVLFLMGVIVLAGALTSLLSEFGVVSIANRALSPLMKPLFGLPGAASIGAVATYLSDNPAIMPLGTDKGFLKYFRKWQVTTLVNLGAVFGMGLIVTTFMLAQSSQAESLGRAVLLGNIGAILGGVVSVRLMGFFGKRKYGKHERVLTEDVEGYDLLRFREVRKGNVPARALQALLDGGTHGVKTGLDIMPGIIIVCTIVMMLAFGPGEGGYTGEAYQGIAFFPWVGEKLSFIIEPLFGLSNPEAIAFPVTSLGSVGAAIAMVPQFLETGIIDAKGICVFTAIGICHAGFLSVHVGMMDGLRERDLTTVAIATHFIGGLCAGVFGHGLFLLWG